MSTAEETLAYYLEGLRQGEDPAFFGVIDPKLDMVPVMMDAFAKEKDRGVRAGIVTWGPGAGAGTLDRVAGGRLTRGAQRKTKRGHRQKIADSFGHLLA